MMAELRINYQFSIDFSTWLVIDNIPQMDTDMLWAYLDVQENILDRRIVQSAQEGTNKSVVLVYDTSRNMNKDLVSFQLKFRGTPFLALRASDVISFIECFNHPAKVDLHYGISCEVHYKFSTGNIPKFKHLFSLFGKFKEIRAKNEIGYGIIVYEKKENAVAAVWGLDGQSFENITLKVWRIHTSETLPPFKSNLVSLFRSIGYMPYPDLNYEHWLAEQKYCGVGKRDIHCTELEGLVIDYFNVLATGESCSDPHCVVNLTQSTFSSVPTTSSNLLYNDVNAFLKNVIKRLCDDIEEKVFKEQPKSSENEVLKDEQLIVSVEGGTYSCVIADDRQMLHAPNTRFLDGSDKYAGKGAYFASNELSTPPKFKQYKCSEIEMLSTDRDRRVPEQSPSDKDSIEHLETRIKTMMRDEIIQMKAELSKAFLGVASEDSSGLEITTTQSEPVQKAEISSPEKLAYQCSKVLSESHDKGYPNEISPTVQSTVQVSGHRGSVEVQSSPVESSPISSQCPASAADIEMQVLSTFSAPNSESKE